MKGSLIWENFKAIMDNINVVNIHIVEALKKERKAALEL